MATIAGRTTLLQVAGPADLGRPATAVEVLVMERTVRIVLLGFALTAAACGGSAASIGPGGEVSATAAAPGAASAAVGSEAASLEIPSMDPSSPELPSFEVPVDVGSGGSVCDLVTASEMASVFGVEGVTQRLFAGPPDTCDFRQDDQAFVAMVLIPTGGQAAWSAYAAETGAQPIDGLGDQAVYSPSTQLVIIRKGDAVVSIAVFSNDLDDATKVERLRSVGEIAAGRM